MTTDNKPAIGSIWVEDYDYGNGRQRRVVVIGTSETGRVLIRTINGRGAGKTTSANPARFGKARGYLLSSEA